MESSQSRGRTLLSFNSFSFGSVLNLKSFLEGEILTEKFSPKILSLSKLP